MVVGGTEYAEVGCRFRTGKDIGEREDS